MEKKEKGLITLTCYAGMIVCKALGYLLIALGVVVQHAGGHCGSPVRAYKGRVRHGHFIALRV